MADFVAKPTNKKPVTSHGEKYENDFKNKTTMHGLNLNEVDGLLTEKEVSLKKKIFSLPKMEALVHPDPKLSAVYNKMAEDGEEKYGYHYNETIMNIIFNDYVLNSPKYLQKYKMAVPKKKKRRDRSGIRQMQKDAEKKIEQSKKMDAEKGITENVGGIRVKFLVHPDDPDVFAYFPDENHDSSGRYKMGYSHIGQHSAVDPQYAAESRPATPEEYDELKNELEQHVGYTLDVMDENFSNVKPAMGKEPAVHGGEVIDTGSSERRDSQDNKLKNAKVKSVLSPDDIEETSTTGSVGGSGMGSGGYATPHAWGGGDLTDKKKKQKSPIQRKPIWNGGTVIQESNYLVDTTGFEKYYNSLNETIDLNVNEIVDDILKEESKSKSQQRFMGMVRGVQKGDINPKDVSNKVKKTAKDMKQSDVKDFAKTKHDKLPEKVNEHHLNTREDMVKFIAKAIKKISNDSKIIKYPVEMIQSIIFNWSDEKIKFEYERAEAKLNELGIDPMSIQINEEGNLNEADDFIRSVEDLKSFIKRYRDRSGETPKLFQFIGMIRGDAMHHVAIHIANKMLGHFTWEELPDTNSMWDYIDYNGGMQEKDFLESIKEAVNDRLANSDMGIEGLDDLNEETDQTMIGGNPESMANKQSPVDDVGGNVPRGSVDSGGLRESEDDEWLDTMDVDDKDNEQDPNKIDWKKVKDIDKKPDVKDKFIEFGGIEAFEENYSHNDPADKLTPINVKADIGRNIKSPIKSHAPSDYSRNSPLKDKFTSPIDGMEMFEELNEELEAFAIHQNKLKSIVEDKKPSSLVMKDRLGKDNESNFKKDMKGSVTKDVVKMEKDMMWKDQQTNVGDKPYKTGEDLEKAAIKTTKGNALKNVGNSDGTKGEIPKRNLTTKEQEDVDEYRLGQQDLVYDNAPDEKFEERMKAGMGEEMYKKRQEKLKKRAEYPMYNKERQPVQDAAVEKVEFNKEKSGWNEREGLKESVLTGKYVNELNKRKLVDFKLSDVKIVESINNMFKVDFTGMGNSIDSRGNVNEAVDNVIDSYKFYTNGKRVVAIKNPVRKLNEGEKKKKPIVSEEFNKMKHLLGYDPKTYVDSKRSKI